MHFAARRAVDRLPVQNVLALARLFNLHHLVGGYVLKRLHGS
jgi:hypothetical protein